MMMMVMMMTMMKLNLSERCKSSSSSFQSSSKTIFFGHFSFFGRNNALHLCLAFDLHCHWLQCLLSCSGCLQVSSLILTIISTIICLFIILTIISTIICLFFIRTIICLFIILTTIFIIISTIICLFIILIAIVSSCFVCLLSPVVAPWSPWTIYPLLYLWPCFIDHKCV